MVPYRSTLKLPLLPYERQLIELLGISREEYEWFGEQTWHKARLRPAGYEHIPDIRCDPVVTPILVSLAVGIATSAVAYLLTPKPKAVSPSSESGGRSIDLASVSGQDRYAPTSGFDSQQSLANYGSPIPLIFTNGGLLISPLLVWSRVLSRGRYQIAEMQFLVGQGPLPIRDDWAAAGGKYGNLFLGNNTLDTGSPEDFAFYYRDGSGTDNRFGAEHLKIGTLRAEVPYAFTAPTSAGEDTWAFSSTFTPTNQAQFGVSNGIPNGTNLRLNWQVISHNQKGDDNSPLDIRNWISGPYRTHDEMRKNGMSGTGTNYARRVGVVGTNVGDANILRTLKDGKAKIYRGDVGTEVVLEIGVGRQMEKFGGIRWENKVQAANQGKDLQNILDGEHAAHDDAMQLGEQFIIGTGLWAVVKREMGDPTSDTSEAYWRTEVVDGVTYSRKVRVTLRCIKKLSGIDATGTQPVQFGTVDGTVIATMLPPYVGVSDNNGDPVILTDVIDAAESYVTTDKLIDEAFFPICKASIGIIQNTRPCDVTEIGIKSQVWLRFNGICNFATIPSPSELFAADQEGTMYQTGYMTKYSDRVSLFSLDIRPIGSAADVEWQPCGETFAVVGNTPVDVFNYIRIIHPARKAYEFRLRPHTSASAVYINGGDWQVIVLDAGKDAKPDPWSRTIHGEKFTFVTNGRKVKIKSLWSSPEMGAATPSIIRVTTDRVASVSFEKYQYRAGTGDTGTPTLQQISDAWKFMLAYRLPPSSAEVNSTNPGVLDTSTPPGSDWYAAQDPSGLPVGTTRSVVEAYRPTLSNMVTFRFNLRVVLHSDGVKRWELGSTEIVSSGTGYSVGSLINKGLVLGYVGSSSTFRTPILELVLKVTTLQETATEGTTTVTRVFGKYTAISEVSQYPNYIQRSCDNGPEHQVVYVNESLNDYPDPAKYPRCAMVGLRLRSGRNFNRLDQFRMFAQLGLQVPTLPAELTTKPLGSSNLFNEVAHYLLTSTETGAGQLAAGLVDEEQMRRCTKFLTNNKLYYTDAITEPINIRGFLGEIAPSMLCALVVRNGVFSVEPAVPVDADGAINTASAVKIEAMFTSGNIIEDTFSVEYLAAEERKDFTAVVRWREHGTNQFPQSRATEAYYSDVPEERRPIEEFDLRWVNNKEHATLAARYFLAIRRHVTHLVKFKTTPLGSKLLPGSYIFVSTDSSPYTPLNNGIVLPDGTIISTAALTEGEVGIYYWLRGSTEVDDGTMTVVKDPTTGVFSTKAPRDAVFSVKPEGLRNNCYMVESITLDEDGMVEVTATHFPLDALNRSIIAREIMGTGGTSIVDRQL